MRRLVDSPCRPIVWLVTAAVLIGGGAPALASVYSQAVLADNPTAYWRFEDPSSAYGDTAADATGNHPGTYTNGATLSGDTPLAAGGQSAGFDGTSQHLTADTLGNVGSSLGTAVTFEFWIKTTDTSHDRIFGVFNDGNNTSVTMMANSNEQFVPTVGNTQLFVRRQGGGDLEGNFDTSVKNIYDGAWHHVVWRLDDLTNKGVGTTGSPADTSAFQVLVDNTPVPVTYGDTFSSTPAFVDFNNPFRIASAGRGAPFSNDYLNAKFDEFAVYTSLLSDGDVAEHFNLASVAPPPPPPLPGDIVARESFNYASGGDLSGNGPGDVGFSGTWGAATPSPALPNDADWDVTSGSLSYPNGVTKSPSGNSASLDGRVGDGGDISQRLSTSIDFDADGTHYVSFLLNKTNGGSSSDYFWAMLRDDAQTGLATKAAWGSASSDVPIIGLNQTTNNTLGSDDLLAGDIFFVGRIDTAASGDDTIYLSTFASSEIVPLIEPAWEFSFSDPVTGLADTLNLSGGPNTIVTFDEFVLGTTYASVTQLVVPEPGTLAVWAGLVLLGVLGVRVRRRR